MKFTKDPASVFGGESGETDLVQGRPITGFETSMIIVGFWTTAYFAGKVVGTVIAETLDNED